MDGLNVHQAIPPDANRPRPTRMVMVAAIIGSAIFTPGAPAQSTRPVRSDLSFSAVPAPSLMTDVPFRTAPAPVTMPALPDPSVIRVQASAPVPISIPGQPVTTMSPTQTTEPDLKPPAVSVPTLAPGQVPTAPRVLIPQGTAVPPPPRPAGDDLPQPLTEAPNTDPLHEISNPQRELTLIVNTTKVFELPPSRKAVRVLIDNPKVADVQFLDANDPSPHILSLFANSFGRATLTIWDDRNQVMSYPVRVVVDEKDLEKRLGQILPGTDIKVRQVAQQVILEGQVPDTRTMAQVLELVQSELRLTGQVSIGSLAGAVGVGSGPGAGGTPSGTNQSVSSQGQSPLSVASTSNAQPGLVIINRVRVPGPRQVLLRVKIAELNRTAMRQIGVSWLDTRNNAMIGSNIGGQASVGVSSTSGQASSFGPAGFLPGTVATPIGSRIRVPQFLPVTSTFGASGAASSGANSQLFGIFNAGEFNLFLNALRTNSLAKILAEPNLVTLDGQPAQFQAGGQFPYPVPQAATAGGGSVITINFANFGAILQFLPQIQENNVIRLDVAPTFSELNFGQGFAIPGAGTVPGINQRTARTVVEMREGQTLAIAGLLSSRTSATTTRIPGLGDLPFVGPWFSSNQIETVETELVVLVTPELVAPMEKAEVPPAPGDSVLEPNDCEFYFLGRIEGKTGHPHRATIQEHDPANVVKHLRSEGQWVIGPHGYAD